MDMEEQAEKQGLEGAETGTGTVKEVLVILSDFESDDAIAASIFAYNKGKDTEMHLLVLDKSSEPDPFNGKEFAEKFQAGFKREGIENTNLSIFETVEAMSEALKGLVAVETKKIRIVVTCNLAPLLMLAKSGITLNAIEEVYIYGAINLRWAIDGHGHLLLPSIDDEYDCECDETDEDDCECGETDQAVKHVILLETIEDMLNKSFKSVIYTESFPFLGELNSGNRDTLPRFAAGLMDGTVFMSKEILEICKAWNDRVFPTCTRDVFHGAVVSKASIDLLIEKGLLDKDNSNPILAKQLTPDQVAALPEDSVERETIREVGSKVQFDYSHIDARIASSIIKYRDFQSPACDYLTAAVFFERVNGGGPLGACLKKRRLSIDRKSKYVSYVIPSEEEGAATITAMALCDPDVEDQVDGEGNVVNESKTEHKERKNKRAFELLDEALCKLAKKRI